MNRIKEGCTAITVNCGIENIGKIVKVGAFIGEMPSFFGSYWEVNQPIKFRMGGPYNFIKGECLQRIDHHPDNQKTKVKKELEIVE